MKNPIIYLFAIVILVLTSFTSVSQFIILTKLNELRIATPAEAKKKYVFATEHEVKLVYDRLLESGQGIGNIGTYERFSDQIKNRTSAYIYYQILEHAGYWNSYGTSQQFLDKFSYPYNYKGERY